ncbi:MAG: TVP38/TMEM64 family protein [Clostridia bacterium]|nr:TVP38/TMEM64 family protein [Clostridia bacterium]
MTKPTKTIIHILCMVLAAALVETFFVLCLAYFKTEWALWLYWFALIGGSVLNAALLTVDIVFYCLKKEAIYKTCITLYIMFAFFAVCFFVLLKTGFMEIFQDEGSFEAYLEKSGNFMTVLFILLQFLQVVILPIPSTVTVVAGSAIFGPLMGSIYSLTGIVIGSLVAFLIGRYAGYRVVAWMIGKETLDKWLKKIKGKDRIFLSAMFLLPVFPDDILCFIAGISSMSVWYFFAVILISRVLAIFTTSYSITLIPLNTWWGLLIWGILIALVIALFVLLYKKSDVILAWFDKKFHRETRVEEKPKKDEFVMEVVNPDGAIVKKGVKKADTDGLPTEKEKPKNQI